MILNFKSWLSSAILISKFTAVTKITAIKLIKLVKHSFKFKEIQLFLVLLKQIIKLNSTKKIY